MRMIPREGKLLRVFIVDSEEKIREFLPQLDGMISDGLVTLEKAEVLVYRDTAGITLSYQSDNVRF